jgi:hypothetical protein
MRFRTSISALAVATIASAFPVGCGWVAVSELDTGIAAAEVVALNTPAHDRPFEGSLEGVANFNMTGREARCRTMDLPFITESAGSGTATHLGRLTWSSSHCTEMPTSAAPPPYFVFERSEMTFVAANGDELYVEGTGAQNDPLDETDPQPMSLVMHCTITGGTGRFANATGGFEMRGEVRLPPGGLEAPDWPVHFDLEGRISY